jgi:hypothetical protein
MEIVLSDSEPKQPFMFGEFIPYCNESEDILCLDLDMTTFYMTFEVSTRSNAFHTNFVFFSVSTIRGLLPLKFSR